MEHIEDASRVEAGGVVILGLLALAFGAARPVRITPDMLGLVGPRGVPETFGEVNLLLAFIPVGVIVVVWGVLAYRN